jgi:hypothetical protein
MAIDLERLIVSFEANTKQFERAVRALEGTTKGGLDKVENAIDASLRRTSAQFARFGVSLNRGITRALFGGAGLTGLVTAAVHFIEREFSRISDLFILGKNLNISTEALQAWAQAARSMGIPAQNVFDALRKINDETLDPQSVLNVLFRQNQAIVGTRNVKDLSDALSALSDIFQRLAPGDRRTLLQKLGVGQEFGDLLGLSPGTLESLRSAGVKAGTIFSDGIVQSMAVNRENLANEAQKLADSLIDAIANNLDKNQSEIVGKLADTLKAVVFKVIQDFWSSLTTAKPDGVSWRQLPMTSGYGLEVNDLAKSSMLAGTHADVGGGYGAGRSAYGGLYPPAPPAAVTTARPSLTFSQTIGNITQQANAVDVLADSLQHELDMLGKSEREQAAMNIAWMGGSTAAQDLARQVQDYKDQLATLNDLNNAVRDSTKGFASDLLNGVSAGDAFNNMLRRLADALLDLAFRNLFAAGGAQGGLLGQLLSFGGINLPAAGSQTSVSNAPLSGSSMRGNGMAPAFQTNIHVSGSVDQKTLAAMNGMIQRNNARQNQELQRNWGAHQARYASLRGP